MLRKGQALIVVLLILAVALTVGLSIVSRSATETSQSTTEEESARALAAAETGIEQALSTLTVGTSGSVTVGLTGGTYNYNTTDYGNTASVSFSPRKSGSIATLLLANYNTATGNLVVPFSGLFAGTNTLNICWGDPSPAKIQVPAVQASLYYYSASNPNYRMKRVGYDPSSRGNFASAGTAVTGDCGGTYDYAVKGLTINTMFGLGAGDTPLFMRLKLLYNDIEDHPLAVGSTTTTFPIQGVQISSAGQAGSSNKKIQVLEYFPDSPTLFDNAVYSGTAISK